MDMKDRVAIVTGAARGIGRAIADRLDVAGATLVIADKNYEGAQAAAAELNDARALEVDVSSEESVNEMVATTLSELGKIDAIVNNAAIVPFTKWDDVDFEQWKLTTDIVLDSVYLCCSAASEPMREAGYGRIVNMASLAGKEGTPNASAYSAAKAGVIALTKSLGKELAGSGALVNCIAPAAVDTAILEQMTEAHVATMLAKSPLGRFGAVEEVAAMTAWLASEECSFNTGAVFDLSGGRATY